MKTLLDHALTYAGLGIRVFPIQPNEKSPPSKFKWKELATTDTAILTKWFGAGGIYQGHNLAAVMGEQLKDGGYSAAIDLDIRPEKNGGEAFMQFLRSEGIEGADRPDGPADAIKRKLWTDTWTQQTPSGGVHIIVRTLAPLRCKTGALVPNGGIDVKAKDGYILVAPSSINGNGYEILRQPQDGIGELPEALERRFAKWKAEPAEDHVKVKKVKAAIDPQRAVNRAIKYLRKAPVSVKGSGGDVTAFKVAAALKDLGCSEEKALDLMLGEHWHHGCGWSPGRLAEKVRNAYHYGREPQGSAAPEAVFEKAETVDTGGHSESPVKAMNRRHAVVRLGNTVAILDERQDAEGGKVIEFMRLDAFKTIYANHTQMVEDKAVPVSKLWLEHPDRRTYDRVEFAPERAVPDGTLNLWQGFAIKPVAGDWGLMRDHILNVVCGGNRDHYEYFVNWVARCFQRPWEVGEVALVLRGRQGVGKGTVLHWIRCVFGRHGLHVAHPEQLVGRFNSHMAAACFLFCDESFFAGDPRQIRIIKSLITEPVLMIEQKGLDAFQVRNCLHIAMASNDDFVIPAAAEERRFFVLDVSPHRMADIAYWKALHRQAYEQGGIAAMLFDLLRRDLSTFEVSRVPRTEALDDQKIAAMKSADRFLFETLQGATLQSEFGGGAEWADAPFEITKKRLYTEYHASAKQGGDRYPMQPTAFFRHLYKLLGATLRTYRSKREGWKVVLPPIGQAREALFRAWGLSADAGNADAGNADEVKHR